MRILTSEKIYAGIALLTSWSCGFCWAQSDESGPRPPTCAARSTPRVHSDLRVTFRLKSARRQESAVSARGDDNGLGRGPMDMTRADDARGVSPPRRPSRVSTTTGSWSMGSHERPGSETYFGWGKQVAVALKFRTMAQISMRPKDVPHGDVRVHWYFSKTTQAWRRAYVVHAARVRRQHAGALPVLYLQHGAGEDQRGWTNQGRANFIPRQPNCRGPSQADDRGDGAGLRHGAGGGAGVCDSGPWDRAAQSLRAGGGSMT